MSFDPKTFLQDIPADLKNDAAKEVLQDGIADALSNGLQGEISLSNGTAATIAAEFYIHLARLAQGAVGDGTVKMMLDACGSRGSDMALMVAPLALAHALYEMRLTCIKKRHSGDPRQREWEEKHHAAGWPSVMQMARQLAPVVIQAIGELKQK